MTSQEQLYEEIESSVMQMTEDIREIERQTAIHLVGRLSTEDMQVILARYLSPKAVIKAVERYSNTLDTK